MSQGDTVVMDKSLEQAFDLLEAQIRQQMQRRDKRFQVDQPTAPNEEEENQEKKPPAGGKSPSQGNAAKEGPTSQETGPDGVVQ